MNLGKLKELGLGNYTAGFCFSVNDGEDGDAANFNSSFMSREIDTSTVAKIDLNDSGSTAITDLQLTVNGKVISPITHADNVLLKTDGVDTKTMQETGISVDDSDNVTGVNNLTVDGNLTVNGTTTTVDSTIMDIKDPNITLNNGGNQATADGTSGLTVEMSDATDVVMVYDSTLASRWKCGDAGSEIEVVNTTTTQTLTSKTLNSPAINFANTDYGTASNTQRLILPNDTTANLAGLTNVNALLAYDNTLNIVAYNNGSGWVNLVSESTTQTLTNKTLTSAVLNTGVSGTAVLDEDDLVSNSDTQLATQQSIKAYVDTQVASGGGGGSKSWLTGDNSNFENDTGDWAAFDDGSVATPVDGTGGSPANISIARTTTAGEVLAGSGSLEITKANTADSQGEGAAVAFSIDYGEQGKQQFISFKMKSGSGFVNGLFQMFVYDVTNATVLNVHTLDGGSGELYATPSTGTNVHGTFFPASDSTSYRFIIMCNGTDTDNFDFSIDEVKIGPIATVSSFNSTEWESFTPTGSWSTSTTYTGMKRRVGDTLECVVEVALSGAPDAVDLDIDLPDGLSIDTAKLLQGDTTEFIGWCRILDSGTATYDGRVLATSTGTVVSGYYFSDVATTSEGSSVINQTSPIPFGNNDRVYLKFIVPISGWDVSDTMSTHQADLRTLKVDVSSNNAQSMDDAAYDTVIFEDENIDTHGAYDTSTGEFTVPFDGDFLITARVQFASVAWVAGEQSIIEIYVNGSGESRLQQMEIQANFTGVHHISGSDVLSLSKGDVVTIRVYQNTGGTLALSTSFSHNRLTITGQPDFSVFGVKGVYEYQDVEITSRPVTTTADTAVAATETLTLSPGTWTLGFAAPMRLQDLGASSNTIQGSIHLYDNTNAAIVDNSAAGFSLVVDASSSYHFQTRGEVEITITETTEYTVRVICSESNATGQVRLEDQDIFGGITGDEMTSRIFARRKK